MLCVHFSFLSFKFFSCLLQLESYQEEVNATFYKDSSSFALFKGRYGLHYDPYQQYSPDDSRVTNREVDRNRIDDLRDWLANFQIPQGILGL
jgi:hypothetical protein